MQKKLIAVAIAAISAAPAFAQSNVTIYGRADYGYLSRSGDDGASPDRDRKNEFASGIGAGSRIGFKGSEDLGNGLKAIFQMEFGMGLDGGATPSTAGGNTSTWWTRNSYVGVTGNFGTVVGGKLDGVRYGIFNKYDAFGGGYSGNFTQMTAQVDRAENAIAYISPKFMGGFDVTLAYATHIGGSNPLGLTVQEGSMASTTNPLRPAGSTGNDGDAELNTIRLAYANGPISVDLDWERVSFKSGGQVGGTPAAPTLAGSSVPALHDNVTVWTVAGSYDFGMVKVAALYDNLKTDNNSMGNRLLNPEVDVDSWFLSASIPFGNFIGKVTYGETENDKCVGSCQGSKWGLGLQYNLSKRTNVYTNYGAISNDRGAAYQISTAANSQGGGYGVKAFDVGIAHSF
jgi:predicted porin